MVNSTTKGEPAMVESYLGALSVYGIIIVTAKAVEFTRKLRR